MPPDFIRDRIFTLKSKLASIAHERITLDDSRGVITYGHAAQRDNVSRLLRPGSRSRISLGRRTARNSNTGILTAVGVPALKTAQIKPNKPEAGIGPEWDTSAPVAQTDVDHYAFGTNIPESVPTETHMALGHVDKPADAPPWCSPARVARDWHLLLRDVLDPDHGAVMSHATTLSTIACAHMIRDSDIGHVEYDPALGRDGRVSLPDIYSDVQVLAVYAPAERMTLSVSEIRERVEGYWAPENLPEHTPPSNGVFES